MKEQLKQLTQKIAAELISREMVFSLHSDGTTSKFLIHNGRIDAVIQPDPAKQIKVYFFGHRTANWTVTGAKRGGTTVKAAVDWLFGGTVVPIN